ncbi:hypothetical protein ES708_34129 [subsurface metagenome]
MFFSEIVESATLVYPKFQLKEKLEVSNELEGNAGGGGEALWRKDSYRFR